MNHDASTTGHRGDRTGSVMSRLIDVIVDKHHKPHDALAQF